MNLSSLKNLLTSAILILFASNAMAWGRVGHETVGGIAGLLIAGSHAEHQLKSILEGDETLASVSIWADCVKGFQYCHEPLTPEMRGFVERNPKHHRYHYTDIPYQNQYYTEGMIGAHPDDVVHVLSEAILTLKKGVPPPGRSWSQREALFLVVHLMGDIHQPLHVGAAYIDEQFHFVVPDTEKDAEQMSSHGGNLLCYRSKPLHAAWDDDFVARVMKQHRAKDPVELSRVLVRVAGSIPAPSGPVEDWVKIWAEESLRVSSHALKEVSVVSLRDAGKGRAVCSRSSEVDVMSDQAYSKTNKVWDIAFPEDYAKQASVTVNHRLLLAGERLALVLEAIWP